MATSPDGPIHSAKRCSARDWYSRPRQRAHSAQAASRIISMPSPAITRNDQNTTVALGRSSRGYDFRPGNWPSQLCVRIRLPRRGTLSA